MAVGLPAGRGKRTRNELVAQSSRAGLKESGALERSNERRDENPFNGRRVTGGDDLPPWMRNRRAWKRFHLINFKYAQERLRRIYAARWRHICKLAMASRQTNIVRTFLDELKERAKKTMGENELPAETGD